MTRHAPAVARDVLRVESFRVLPSLKRETLEWRQSARRAVVRVTHASVGITDVMAVRGDYVLHPLPGFVPGYDFVGLVESLPVRASGLDGTRSLDPRIAVGQRVAGILPRMGAHATRFAVDPALLVPVPDGLDSATAATVPLDAVTAAVALRTWAGTSGAVLVQGAGGAVGGWAVQLARAAGRTVYGTASARSGAWAEQLGATVLDYRDPTWIDRLIAASGGGVTGVIDHTGSPSVCRAARPDGRVVRTSFGGVPGRQRSAAVTGALRVVVHLASRPSERIVSVPVHVAVHRGEYRRILGDLLGRVLTGDLVAPRAQEFPLHDYGAALASAEAGEPGVKAVLRPAR